LVGDLMLDSGLLREVVAICRAVGRGDEDLDFEFAADVVRASSYPAWMHVGVACRLYVNLASLIEGATLDGVLDGLLEVQGLLDTAESGE